MAARIVDELPLAKDAPHVLKFLVVKEEGAIVPNRPNVVEVRSKEILLTAFGPCLGIRVEVALKGLGPCFRRQRKVKGPAAPSRVGL